MIRVLSILAVLVAFAVSAAPASAGKPKYRTIEDEDNTYLTLELETTLISNYRLDAVVERPAKQYRGRYHVRLAEASALL
jgi:hypothetical protein